MLCYQDKTFCAGHGCQKFATCPRALTEEVRKNANEYGLPISQYCDPTKLECYENTEKED